MAILSFFPFFRNIRDALSAIAFCNHLFRSVSLSGDHVLKTGFPNSFISHVFPACLAAHKEKGRFPGPCLWG